MRNKSLRKAQKTFKKTMDRYIKVNGKPVTIILPEISADCPNCISDTQFGQNESSNVYNISFIRPVNVFAGTSESITIYPQPFNISSLPSGIVLDPSVSNPKILKTTICPVCKGKGKLTVTPSACISANWNWGSRSNEGEIIDYSAGRTPDNVALVKTDLCNYALCRDAKKYILQGVECEMTHPPIKKGVGSDAFIQIRVQKIDSSDSTSNVNDYDRRLNTRPIETVSSQAPEGDPHSPPNTFSNEDW